MTVIFESKNGKTAISKLRKGVYRIAYPYSSETKRFWVNFPWHHLGKTEKENEDLEEKRVRQFHAKSVQTLPQFLSREKRVNYQQALDLFRMIGFQLHALENFGHTILSLEMANIVVVNDSIFLLVEDSNLITIKNSMVEIKRVQDLKKFQKSKFVAPEIKKITSFPKKILPFSAFYNLAALTVYCLFKAYYTEEKETVLHPIFHTKLYWALKRCLDNNPKKRFFLLI